MRPQLDRRTDLIFADGGESGVAPPEVVHADVLGESLLERAMFGMWPSDHATVYARVRYPVQ